MGGEGSRVRVGTDVEEKKLKVGLEPGSLSADLMGCATIDCENMDATKTAHHGDPLQDGSKTLSPHSLHIGAVQMLNTPRCCLIKVLELSLERTAYIWDFRCRLIYN